MAKREVISKRAGLMLLLGIACGIGIASYSNLYLNDFVMEDQAFRIPRPAAGYPSLSDSFLSNLKSVATPPDNWTYQPLTWMTYAVDQRIYDDNPAGFHLTQFLLHSVLAVAFGLLLWRLLSMTGSSDAAAVLAVVGATWWAVNRINCGVVERLSQRGLIMGGMSLVTGLLFFVTWRKGYRRLLWFAPFALGILADHAALLFPLLLLPLMILFADRLWDATKTRSELLRKMLLFFWLAAGTSIFFMLLLRFIEPNSASALQTRSARVLYFNKQLIAWPIYIYRFLLPIHVSIHHADWSLQKFDFRVLASLLLLSGMLYGGLWIARRWPASGRLFLYGMLWFFITLLPNSSIFVQPEIFADTRVYLPMMGLVLSVLVCAMILIQHAGDRARPRVRQWLSGLAMLLLCGNGAGSYLRNTDFRTQEHLVRVTAASDPRSPQAIYDLADLEISHSRGKAAAAALDLLPGDPPQAETEQRRARIARQAGDHPGAILHYENAYRLNKTHSAILPEYAVYLSGELGDTAAAKNLLSRAINDNPEALGPRLLLAGLLRTNKDIADFCRLVAESPELASMPQVHTDYQALCRP